MFFDICCWKHLILRVYNRNQHSFLDPRNCPHRHYSYAGELTSPGFPNNYRNNLNCHYDLTCPPSLNVALHFTFFDIEHDVDYVDIIDNSSRIARYICSSFLYNFHSVSFFSVWVISWRITNSIVAPILYRSILLQMIMLLRLVGRRNSRASIVVWLWSLEVYYPLFSISSIDIITINYIIIIIRCEQMYITTNLCIWCRIYIARISESIWRKFKLQL